MTREEIALREWQLSGDELTIRFTRPYRDGTDAECVAKAVRAFVEALAKPGADVPEGWVLVPREPTEAMIGAYCEAHHELGFHAWANCSVVWPRMLATAPPAPADDGDGWRPIATALSPAGNGPPRWSDEEWFEIDGHARMTAEHDARHKAIFFDNFVIPLIDHTSALRDRLSACLLSLEFAAGELAGTPGERGEWAAWSHPANSIRWSRELLGYPAGSLAPDTPKSSPSQRKEGER